ncbi:MAG: exodeoxyribonuclease III [Saezia sp.]
MFRLISLNLNGIRSAHRKGVESWLEKVKPDCLCVQELKAQASDIEAKFEELAGLKGYFHYAKKPGYSGVAVYTRHEPTDVIYGMGSEEFDAEGRYVEARFDTPNKKVSVISCYFPSGSSSEERQEAKWRFLDYIYPHFLSLHKEREYILCGDVNIAHNNIDIKNWRGNQKNSGFLPEERAWLTRLLSEGGLVDVFRGLTQEPDLYTWWSNRGKAWENNVGWRIDYHLSTPGLASKAKEFSIYTQERFSDHAPLVIDYEADLLK